MEFEKLSKRDYKQLMGINSDSEKNQNHIILRFIDFDYHPQIITKKLGLEPRSIGLKDEKVFFGQENQFTRINECSHWDYEWKINSNDFIGDLLGKFFKEIIIPNLDIIKDISNTCETTRLIIVQYYYDSNNPGYGFEKEQIKILAEINAEIDMDIYCLFEDN